MKPVRKPLVDTLATRWSTKNEFIYTPLAYFCYANDNGRGRRQNLNPEPKNNLNHANLEPPNLWAVVSQEFAAAE